jgi:hypothetical protein
VLRAALDYAARGWPVFPCDPDKRPLVKNGFYDATTDESVIRGWWSRRPNAMIGLPTGQASGLWALDLGHDEAKGLDGTAALAAIERRHAPLPYTIRSWTPRGGMHVLFRWREGVRCSTSKVAPGIDVRGDGGYVVLPPSVRAVGAAYQWEDPPGLFDLAEAPEWLLDLVRGSPAAAEPPRPISLADCRQGAGEPLTGYGAAALDRECQAVESAPKGERNAQLNRAAFNLGQLVAGGEVDEREVRARLLGAATASGLVQDDGRPAALRTLESGLGRGMENPRTRPEHPTVAPFRRSEPIARGRREPDRAVRAALEANHGAPSGLRFTTFDAIGTMPHKKWLISGMLGAGELSVWFGPPGSGKSLGVGDAACHVAAGLPWHGRRVEQTGVLYLAAERPALVERRLAA